MLDRLDYLQTLLPSEKTNRVVPVYMFTTDDGLPVILRINMGNTQRDVPVALVAFDIDPITPTFRCEVQYPREGVKRHLYGRLTGKRFVLGTTKIENWQTLEGIVTALLVEQEAEPVSE